jgi:hypothetical protein
MRKLNVFVQEKNQKLASGVTQVIKGPSKHEALSSNLSATHTKKKGRRKPKTNKGTVHIQN